MILTELERFSGLCILATNRPMDIDEAMHRRITLAVEFHKPDRFAREQIWKNLHPPKLQLDDNVNLCELARKYELTGGHIKNAWLSAIGQMVQRGGTKVRQEDLTISCSDQIVGRLSLEEFDQRIVPTCGLESLIVSDIVRETLASIVHYTQAQTVLFGSWGFGTVHRAKTGVTALFCGIPGTGKTMAAEAISFDLGKPLMVVNLSELVSKWVGETGQNIAAVFDSAKSKDVVLVFDEAEGLFGERSSSTSDGVSRHDNMNVGLLLQYMESFTGVCIVITNKENLIDDAFFRRFNYVVQFERPNTTMREKIWKTMIPNECPLRNDVDLPNLAQRYQFCGGDIKRALFHAAMKAALRNHESERMITQNDLESACHEVEKKCGIVSSLSISGGDRV
jgi:SpoVK/Ycf46/Vps4 family AAA+-type ATPase